LKNAKLRIANEEPKAEVERLQGIIEDNL